VHSLVRTVLVEEEKRNLKAVALELYEIRRFLEVLAETLVNLSDKEVSREFNASQDGVKENQVNNYREKLEKQVDIAEKEFRS
jgi:hypothetical protein